VAFCRYAGHILFSQPDTQSGGKMKFEDSINNASRISTAVLTQMARHGVAATPLAYHLWYLYISDANTELHQAMDKLLAAKRGLLPTKIEQLYQQFVPIDSDNSRITDQVAQVSQEVQHIIDDASDEISNTCSEASRYTHELDQTSNGIDEDLSANELRDIINSLVKETQHMMEHSSQMALRLNTMSGELTSVRTQFDQVKKESLIDSLTGVANRKAFDVNLTESMRDAAETDKPLCLIMADIDHFKKFNDTHGHVVGDKVLRYVSKMLQQVLKGRDVVARYGGEEFAIILSDTPVSGANSVAEEIRRTVASAELQLKSSAASLGSITMSFGIADYLDGDSEENFIQRADAALYDAKDSGRNQVKSVSAA
jgi:diguanylate cyclase